MTNNHFYQPWTEDPHGKRSYLFPGDPGYKPLPTRPWWLPRWAARLAWKVAFRAYNWLEDRRPGGDF